LFLCISLRSHSPLLFDAFCFSVFVCVQNPFLLDFAVPCLLPCLIPFSTVPFLFQFFFDYTFRTFPSYLICCASALPSPAVNDFILTELIGYSFARVFFKVFFHLPTLVPVSLDVCFACQLIVTFLFLQPPTVNFSL